MKKNVMLTGCAGFIGANFVKKICTDAAIAKNYNFVIVDALTYAGYYPSIQADIERHEHLSFVQANICDRSAMQALFDKHQFHGVMNFAAESHVDRSITNPNIFLETNVFGSVTLLNCALAQFKKAGDFRYLQVSTDEVYGTLGATDPAFTEATPIAPNSPYSASKASADLMVRAYHETYKLPTLITRCSNNYGPFQFPEKLIPLMIHNALKGLPLPVYGNGMNIRDWIHVHDHNRGVWDVYSKGRAGEVYNLGGQSEMVNLDIVKLIVAKLKKSESLIKFVTDRPGHDFRYAMDFSKTQRELGWKPQVTFEQGLEQTIQWYLDNQAWVEEVKNRK